MADSQVRSEKRQVLQCSFIISTALGYVLLFSLFVLAFNVLYRLRVTDGTNDVLGEMCPLGCCGLYCGSGICAAPLKRGEHSRWSSVLCWWPSGAPSSPELCNWQTALGCSISAHFQQGICRRTAAPWLGRCFSGPSGSGVTAVPSWSVQWC